MSAKKRILITSALPYVAGVKHLGNLVGSMLPADIFARFCRARGHETVAICATDEHGAPIELAALEEGIPPRAFCDKWHAVQKTLGEDFGLAWDNFGRTMMEYALLSQLAAKPERIVVEGHEALAVLAHEGRPAILFCAHLGNWEIIPMALARLAKPLTIVYRPPNNPLVDEIIGEVRRPYTAGMAPKNTAGARIMLKALNGGEHLILVVDQKINTGMEIPFFGRGAFTGDAVVRLAMRFDCPVFPVRTERLGDGRFKVSVEDPWRFAPDGNEADVRAALTRINGRLEDWIRARPGQWLWMHKRWPT
jgi:KDO2-lipid IV(A) lauroyltransferase